MNVVSELVGSTCTIRVSGHFDFACRAEFKNAYTAAGKSLTYVVDISAVDYLDSAALGILLLLRDFAGGTRVTLLGARAQPAQVLKIANFHKLFRFA